MNSIRKNNRILCKLILIVTMLCTIIGLVYGEGINTSLVWQYKEHSNKVMSVAFSSDGKTIVSGSSDKNIKLWDAATGQLLNTIKCNSNICYVSFGPDNNIVSKDSALVPSPIVFWDKMTSQRISELTKFDGTKFVFSPDGKNIAFGNLQQDFMTGIKTSVVEIWDIATKTKLTSLEFSKSLGGLVGVAYIPDVSSVAYSPDGKTIVAAGMFKGRIKVWDLTTNTILFSRDYDAKKLNYQFDVKFSPDGKKIIVASVNLLILDAATGNILFSIKDGATAIDFSPDGKLIASTVSDKIIKLWNPDSGELLTSITLNSGKVQSIAFSPDGKTLVAGVSDGSVRLYSISY
jgi:WD40 repeat protein